MAIGHDIHTGTGEAGGCSTSHVDPGAGGDSAPRCRDVALIAADELRSVMKRRTSSAPLPTPNDCSERLPAHARTKLRSSSVEKLRRELGLAEE